MGVATECRCLLCAGSNETEFSEKIKEEVATQDDITAVAD